jgi:hypothetical protein
MNRGPSAKAVLGVTILLLTATTVSAERKPNYPPMPKSSWRTFAKRISELQANPPHLTPDRLPKGYKIGRCLLKVQGVSYVSGKCAYLISSGGDFQMDGPRQVYTGIDYPEPEIYSNNISTDYFVQVGRALEPDDTYGKQWEGHWGGEDKRATHAHSYLGILKRSGACYSNKIAKICLWKA